MKLFAPSMISAACPDANTRVIWCPFLLLHALFITVNPSDQHPMRNIQFPDLKTKKRLFATEFLNDKQLFIINIFYVTRGIYFPQQVAAVVVLEPP